MPDLSRLTRLAPPLAGLAMLWALIWGGPGCTTPAVDLEDDDSAVSPSGEGLTSGRATDEAQLFVRLQQLRIDRPEADVDAKRRERARATFQRARRQLVEQKRSFQEVAASLRSAAGAPRGRLQGDGRQWRSTTSLEETLLRRLQGLDVGGIISYGTDDAWWLVRLEGRDTCRGMDTACRETSACINAGKCCQLGEQCQVGTDVGCRQSQICRRDGRCEAGRRGCRVGDDADCRRSLRCKEAGACFKEGDQCIARLNVDCRRSKGCDSDGRCVALHGTCVESDVARERCLTLGQGRQLDLASAAGIPPGYLTERLQPIDGACRLPADFDCSELCERWGLCDHKVTRHCMPGSEESPETCSPSFALCRATKDTHCRGSVGCRERGTCQAVQTVLVERRCPMGGGTCRHIQRRRHVCMADAESCADSTGCKQHGACGVVVDRSGMRRCAPTERAHCIEATVCETQGRCQLSDNRCSR